MAKKTVTFLFTCMINHLHNPHKIRKKCLKIRCHNLIVESRKMEVRHVLPSVSSSDVQYRHRERGNSVVLRALRENGSGIHEVQ